MKRRYQTTMTLNKDEKKIVEEAKSYNITAIDMFRVGLIITNRNAYDKKALDFYLKDDII